MGYDESSVKNAGILMVVEAENVKQDLSSFQTVEGIIIDTLKRVGFSIESTIGKETSTIIVIAREGYVTARLHPEKSYVGLDIKLWANFDLMETARDALVQSLGGSEEGTSSFRIVVGGMGGSPFEELDRTKIGPRVVNNRNCEPASSPASDGNMVDLKKSGLESSLEMVEDGVVAAVMCGSADEECKSLEILKKAPTSKLQEVLPIYTCASMSSKGDEFSPLLQSKMAKCEIELSDALSRAGDKISLLVVDDSATQIMICATDRLEPQSEHSKKCNLVPESFFSTVLGERHISHVTYSTTYFRNKDSIYLGTYFPRMIKRWFPSMFPSVPNSAKKKAITCSGERCIIEQISWKLTHIVFLLVSIVICGGLILRFFLSTKAGLFVCNKSTTKFKSSS